MKKVNQNTSYPFGWHDRMPYEVEFTKGLSSQTVRDISEHKKEPRWMLRLRLDGLKHWEKIPLPSFGPDLSALHLEDMSVFRKVSPPADSWSKVPQKIKKTFEKLGIPKAEREVLAGVKTQYESETIYESLQKQLALQGVVFTSMDRAVQDYPELVHKHFASVVAVDDNAFAALNTALWSGGTFLYVPSGVTVEMPLQAYFRLNSELFGQFERTLIIIEKGAAVHYLEGCSAPVFSKSSLHAGVVEIVVEKEATCRYSTLQNWYRNVWNLVTKRAVVKEKGKMIWIDGNIGAKTTMKYPGCILAGKKAHGELLSVSFADHEQEQDTGGNMIHAASYTTSKIIAKSVSTRGGENTFRSRVGIPRSSAHCRSKVVCQGLNLDTQSVSVSLPYFKADSPTATIEHEASVSPLEAEAVFYLKTRGLSSAQAQTTLVTGFIQPLVETLPVEQSVELVRLIETELEEERGYHD